MTKLADLKTKWLRDDTVYAEYEAQAYEFAIARALIEARTNADLTQAGGHNPIGGSAH